MLTTGCPRPAAAQELSGLLLVGQPDRWAHTQAVAAQAEAVACTVLPRDRDLLLAAAWLHDIGYAGELVETGFHPLDGANYLLGIGAPMRLVALVAHHSEASLIAKAYGLLSELVWYPMERGQVYDALVYADMTAGPAGERMSVSERLADGRRRHADDEPRVQAARLNREPVLTATVERVQRRLAVIQDVPAGQAWADDRHPRSDCSAHIEGTRRA